MSDELTYHAAFVDLNSGQSRTDVLPSALVRQYLGGRGMGMYLYQANAGSSNRLVIAAGPLTAQPGGRFCLVAKSPVSGQLTVSTSGSAWGKKLQRAGYDALVLDGCASVPSYLLVDGHSIQLLPASGLAGACTSEVIQKLRFAHGNEASILCIGPAGEHLVSFSVFVDERQRAFGRGGLGAVLGSMNLKALVVRSDEKADAPCNNCPIACGHEKRDDHRAHWPCTPELEPECNRLCNEYGLDAISASAALSHVDASSTPEALFTEIHQLALGKQANQSPNHFHRKNKKTGSIPAELSAVIDSMGYCLFTAGKMDWKAYAERLSAVTGVDFSVDDLKEAGKLIIENETDTV